MLYDNYKIAAVHYSRNERWDRLKRGFINSVQKNTTAELDFREPEFPKEEKQEYKYTSNNFKLKIWRDIIYETDKPTVLMDTDIIVLDDINDGFKADLTLTKPYGKWINAGVVFVIPNERTRAFFDMWVAKDDELYNSTTKASRVPISLHKAWRQTKVLGQNQTALKMIYDDIPCSVEWVDGAVYNCCKGQMFMDEAENPQAKVIHVKSQEDDFQDCVMRAVTGQKYGKHHKLVERILSYYVDKDTNNH